jgi:hypothetical protein
MNKGTTDETGHVVTREYYGGSSYDGHCRCSEAPAEEEENGQH